MGDLKGKEVCVLGAGIVGLTTAVVAAERGAIVRVLAERISPFTTSDTAAAVWFPYAVSPREKAIEWSRTSFDRFLKQSRSRPDLVNMVEFFELFADQPGEPWWASALDSHRHLSPDELPSGFNGGIAAWVPVIESSPYLSFLCELIKRSGGQITELGAPVRSFSEIDTSTVFNCTGLGASALCDDQELYPIRGQVVRVERVDGIDRTYADDALDDAPVYIVPRIHDLILGGTAVKGDSDLGIRANEIDMIIRRCSTIVPAIATAKVLGAKVGLRPGRNVVRLVREVVGDQTVIHNYGHGGAGFTISWGCAATACGLF